LKGMGILAVKGDDGGRAVDHPAIEPKPPMAMS